MKITTDEIAALAQLLNRALMTRAESLWVQTLLNKLAIISAEMQEPVDMQDAEVVEVKETPESRGT